MNVYVNSLINQCNIKVKDTLTAVSSASVELTVKNYSYFKILIVVEYKWMTKCAMSLKKERKELIKQRLTHCLCLHSNIMIVHLII